MDREMNTLDQAGTWERIPCPARKNIVGSKRHSLRVRCGGTPDGSTQVTVYGVDCSTGNTFSPVSQLTNLAIEALNDRGVNSTSMARALKGAGGVRRSISYPGGSCMMQEPPGYEEGVKTVCGNHCTVCTPQTGRAEVVHPHFPTPSGSENSRTRE